MRNYLVLIILCFGWVENRKVTKEQALKIIEILSDTLNLNANTDSNKETSLTKDRRKAIDHDAVAEDYDEDPTGLGAGFDTEPVVGKPCAITVIANYHDREMPTLIRRYRYNANGILIPNSVKYFMKVSLDGKGPPVLVPFSQKSFSPTGGFVSYYKQVPPIPHSL